jgi:hypothetical protein
MSCFLQCPIFYNLLVSNESVCLLYRCNPVRFMHTPIILYFHSYFLSQMLKREYKTPVKASHIFVSMKRLGNLMSRRILVPVWRNICCYNPVVYTTSIAVIVIVTVIIVTRPVIYRCRTTRIIVELVPNYCYY